MLVLEDDKQPTMNANRLQSHDDDDVPHHTLSYSDNS